MSASRLLSRSAAAFRAPLPWPAPRAPAAAVAALFPVAGNPVPAGMRAGLFGTRDGVNLRYAMTRPGERGTVVLLNGRGDCIEKYFEVAADLRSRGFGVATLDWRGQGGSQRLHPDRTRNHVDSFARLVDDLRAFVATVVEPELPGPRIGLAHSMGAAVMLHALSADAGLVDRAVLTAPMIALAPSLQPPGAEWMARLGHAARLGGRPIPGPAARGQPQPAFDPRNWLSSDPVRYRRSYEILAAAPHLGVGRPTIGWVKAAFDGMARFRDGAFAGTVSTPVLVVAGEGDAVVDTAAARRLASCLPQGAFVALPDCAHDVIMERDAIRDRFWEAFDTFTGAAPG